MLATTSPQTKTTSQAIRDLAASVPKSEAVEKLKANQKADSDNVKGAIKSTEIESSPEKKIATVTPENTKTAAKMMVQPAHQWRNCSKPHRI